MKNYIGVGALASAVFMGGCASIFTNGQYPTTFDSNPSGSTVTVTNSEGVALYKGKTPATVTLKSSSGYFSKMHYMAHFEDDCYQSADVNVQTDVTGWYWGNILFGGIIGLLIVDPATGDMYKIDPDHYSVALTRLKTPECLHATAASTETVPARDHI